MPRILFVSGFHPATRARDLAFEFERFGALVRCDVPAPRNPHASSNPYAFVEFRSQRDAEDAYYEMHGRNFEGSRLSIQWAKNPPSSVWRFDRRSPPPRSHRRSDRSRSPPRRDSRGDTRRRSSRSPPPPAPSRRSRSPAPASVVDRDYDRDRRDRERDRDRDRRRSLSPVPVSKRDERDRDRERERDVTRDGRDRDAPRDRAKTPPLPPPSSSQAMRVDEKNGMAPGRDGGDRARTPPYDG